MNIKDVDPKSIPSYDTPRHAAGIIFGRQMELEEKYWEIEKRPSRLIQINDRGGQILIKDFLWRAMEEVGEFFDARIKGEEDHSKEELADTLHFVTGLCVITNSANEFVEGFDLARTYAGERPAPARLIMAAGRLGNYLKMKPWKQTDILTDEAQFKGQLREYVISFIEFCSAYGLGKEELFKLYWLKSEVNLFRIRSMY